jgi:hypothetical protein
MATSQIEFLESRIAPAAVTVTVTFDKGALVLTSGNDAATYTVMGQGDNTILLQGTGDTEFHMAGATDSATLVLTGALKSVAVNLGNSDDEVGLAGLIVGGDVTIAGGDGV